MYQDGAGVKNFYYIHTDHLGSWLKITDQSGNVKNRYSYDAWGRPRSPSTWALMPIGITDALVNNLNAMQPRFDRGYTGHEHMCGFGLINMNGRLYDPYLQRFLSPDRYVQSPFNAQSYNRYTYCLNNPLIYTDPSGYLEAPTYYWGTPGSDEERAGSQTENKRHADPGFSLYGRNNMGFVNGSFGYTYLGGGYFFERGTGRTVTSAELSRDAYVTNPDDIKKESEKNEPSGQGGDPNSYTLFSNRKDAEEYINQNAKKDGKEMFWYILDDGKVIVGPWSDALPNKTSPRYAEQFFMGGKIKYEDTYYQGEYFVHLHFKGPKPTQGVDNIINGYFWRNGSIKSLIYWNNNYYYHQNGEDIIVNP